MTKKKTEPESMAQRIQIATRIKQLRKAQGYTQKDVAHFLGITPQAFSLLERGDTALSVFQLSALAKWLHAPVGYLIDGERIGEPGAEAPNQAEERADEPDQLALDLPQGMSYGDISEEGKAELYKFLQYLKMTYPAKK